MLTHGLTVLVLAILAGSCVGSFVNVVIDRLPAMLDRRWRDDALGSLHIAPQDSRPVFNLAWPGSRCSACGAPVKPRDNIPVLSWIMLRGRCRHCAAPIAVRLPGVEAAGAILVLAVLAVWGYTVGALAFYVFLMALLAAAVIDAETQLVPDEITLPLVWLGLLAAAFLDTTPTPVDAIVGAAAGYATLWLIYQVHRLITRREGMGYGDFKLLAALGAWLGWQALPSVALIACLLGIGYAAIGLIRGSSNRSTPIPFGPFLVTGGAIALFFPARLPLLQTLG